jgi:thiol-disulfide isomerase/thioredoxin
MAHQDTSENRFYAAALNYVPTLLVNVVFVVMCGTLMGNLCSCASTRAAEASSSGAAQNGTAQSGSTEKASLPQGAPPPVLGETSWEEWKRKAGWASYKDETFKPIPAILQRIEEDLNADKTISFIVFSGTWCDDAKTEMPRLFQVLEGANVSKDRIKLIGVNEQKFDPTGSAERFGVALVPTIVVMKNGKENGRISEHPRTSWELDLVVVIER